MNPSDNTRREFLAKATGLAGLSWLGLNAPMLLAAAEAATEQRDTDAGWMNLSAAEAAVLSAAVDQVIPPDETPGAAEIGVVYFIDQALGGFMANAAGMLKEGVEDLDERARAAFPDAAGFAGLAFEQQTGLLQPIDATPFFNTLIFLTHLGMFAMPAHGGNRDQAGWDLIGFDSRHAWQPPFGFYDAQAAAEGGPDGE